MKEAIEASDSKDLMEKLEKVQKNLENGHLICTKSFEDYIFQPIVQKRNMQDGFKRRKRSGKLVWISY